MMGNSAYIQFAALKINDLRQGVNGGELFRFCNQFKEKLFLHNIGIHEDVAVFCVSVVRLDREHTFLFVQIQNIAF